MVDYNSLIKNTVEEMRNEIFTFNKPLNLKNKEESKEFTFLENKTVDFHSMWKENEDLW